MIRVLKEAISPEAWEATLHKAYDDVGNRTEAMKDLMGMLSFGQQYKVLEYVLQLLRDDGTFSA